MLNIQITVDEINVIIGALSKLPYEDVAGLINNVREQALKQLSPPAPPPAAPIEPEACDSCSE